MSLKHPLFALRQYLIIARALAAAYRHSRARGTVWNRGIRMAQEKIEVALEQDNPKFDREKFRHSIFGFVSDKEE